jgi:hypothetical protein
MKRKRDRSESGQLRNKINRWVRFLSKDIQIAQTNNLQKYI